MCDANDYAVGVVLSQSKDKKHYAISYERKTLTGPQLNYATTERELLTVVFAIEKFRSYWVGTKVVVYTYHAALDKERCKTTHDLMDTSTPII
jgi:hypothetical protein